jgi:hypothetical protein
VSGGGTQDVDLWPVLPPLPSYGRGRELPGPRYGSVIHGQHIDDFVLTGKLYITHGFGFGLILFHQTSPSSFRVCHLLCLVALIQPGTVGAQDIWSNSENENDLNAMERICE